MLSSFSDGTLPEHLAIQAPPAVLKSAERAHQAFLESLRSKLAITSGCDTRATFIGTEQDFMAGYLTDAHPGAHNVPLGLEPLTGCAVLRFSSKLLFRVLDILLASPADAAGPRTDSITEIEFHVLRGFFCVFAEVLKETWRSFPQPAFTLLPKLSEESLRTYGEWHALVLKSTLEIDGAGGEFDVVIPSFLARLPAGAPGHRGDETIATQARITAALGSANVELDAVLSTLTIRIGDLMELAPGQILLTEKTAESGFECVVNKRTQFHGELVSAGDRYGFQLGEPVEAEPPTAR